MKPKSFKPVDRPSWARGHGAFANVKSQGSREAANLDFWWLVHFREAQADAVLQQLERYGFEGYRPMCQRRKRVGSKNVMAAVPFFPGYLFARRVRDGARSLTSLHGVEFVYLKMCADKIVEGLKSREVDDYIAFVEDSDPMKDAIKAGDTVEMLNGLVEAMVSEINPAGRLVLLMKLMGQDCELIVDAARVVRKSSSAA